MRLEVRQSDSCDRDWVECLAALAVDKHLEVRRMAEQALAAVHSRVDSDVLREHLASVDLASDARTTLLQILQVPLSCPASLVRSTKNTSWYKRTLLQS